MTSRERFEAFISAPPFEKDIGRHLPNSSWPGQYLDYEVEISWEGWQAAEAETARRCAALCRAAVESKEGAAEAESDIRSTYPEAFK